MIIAQSAAVSIGFVLDAIFGDPDFKLHPIRLIGYLISFLEKVMRRIFTKNERLGGAVMVICVLIICGGVPFAKMCIRDSLITIRGKKLLENADIIIYAGSLVNPELLEYAKDSAEIYNSAKMNLDEVIDVMKHCLLYTSTYIIS